jgi:hypothetical protein
LFYATFTNMDFSHSPKTAKLWRNFYAEYTSGTLWNRIHKLTTEEKAKYKIDWEY